MKSKQFTRALEDLGLAERERAAKFFGVDLRTLRRWEREQPGVPHLAAMVIALIESQHQTAMGAQPAHQFTVEDVYKLTTGKAL